MRQKTPSIKKLAASVLKPTSSWKHVLFSSTKNILFPNENTLLGKQINFFSFSSASLNIGPQKTLVERTTPEHFRKTTRIHFCSKSDRDCRQTKRLIFYANRDVITIRLKSLSRQSIKTLGLKLFPDKRCRFYLSPTLRKSPKSFHWFFFLSVSFANT